MKKSATKLRAKFMLCEDARPEASGKISFLGAYVGEKIIVFSQKNKLPKGLKAVAVFGPLAIVVTVSGKRGKYQSRFALIAPDGTTMLEGTLGTMEIPKDGAASLIAKISQMIVPRWGTFTARFVLGQQTLEFPFEIVAAPVGARIPKAPLKPT
jgi:hypothetical protein